MGRLLIFFIVLFFINCGDGNTQKETGNENTNGSAAGTGGEKGSGTSKNKPESYEDTIKRLNIQKPLDPVLRDCLKGENPKGCAKVPELKDWKCPSGWLAEKAFGEIDSEDAKLGLKNFSYCKPQYLPDFCPEGQIPSLETGNCKELGDACPSGDWPDKLAQGQNIIYVKPGSNGDGKKTSPFGSIQKAVTNAKENSIIALAKGQYKGKIILNKRLQIIGACSKEVKISNDLKTKDKLIIEAQKAVSLFNLSISGYSGAIKINNNKSKSVLKGIILKDIIGDSALIVENSHLEINGLFIENISGFKNVKESGGGVLIKDSEVFMEKVFINKSRNHAISISGEKSQVKIKSIIIKKTLKDEQTKNYGFGIQLSKGNLSLERALFKENQGTDIFLTAAKSIQLKDININGSDSQGINCRESENVFLERISILNNQYGMYFHKVKMPNPSKDILIKNSMGFALSLANQNEANFERISILENQDTGVFSNGPSSKNYIKDALIMENGGAGVMLNNGKLNLIRSLINRNKRNGVSVIAESNAQFEDVYVNQNLDAGLELKGRSSLVGKRISFINNYQVSLAVSEYSNLSFDEALIKKTQGSQSYSGKGLAAWGGANLEFRKAVFSENSLIAIILNGGSGKVKTNAKFVDLVVQNTKKSNVDERYGIGMGIENEASVNIERAIFIKNRVSGLYFDNSLGTLKNLQIKDTFSQKSDGVFGRGLQIKAGSKINAERLLVLSNKDVGVGVFGTGSHLTLKDAIIEKTSRSDCYLKEYNEFCKKETQAGSFGLVSVNGAAFSLDNVIIKENKIGVLFARGIGKSIFKGGIIAENDIGADINNSGYKSAEIFFDVQYFNNLKKYSELSNNPPSSQNLKIPDKP